MIGRGADRTFAFDVAIRQEHFLDRIVQLAHFAPRDFSGLAQARENVSGQLLVLGRMRGVIKIEIDMERGEIFFVTGLDILDEFLGRDSGFFRRQHDRRAMRIVGADKMHRVAGHASRTHPDIRLDVAEQMADMQRAIRIRQRTGDKKLASVSHSAEIHGLSME